MTESLLIPDLSEWQGAVDWAALVAAPYPAVIIRAYNGQRSDDQFAVNREHAHAVGVRALGLYAYLDPTRDVVDQAAEYVHTVGVLRPGEWPIVDVETGPEAADRTRAWMAYVARAVGADHPEWLYSGEAFYRAQGLAEAVPASRTWLAAWGPDAPPDGEALWQYTDHRTVPGVTVPVDCSVYRGTVEQLLAAITPKAPTAPRPTPGPTSHPRFPFPVGIHPGGTTPSAIPLQRALKLTGWMAANVVESDHYGPATQTAVEGFNAKHGWNDRGVAQDPAIGPLGWALLMTLAYGAA
jgi:hypothetical protein